VAHRIVGPDTHRGSGPRGHLGDELFGGDQRGLHGGGGINTETETEVATETGTNGSTLKRSRNTRSAEKPGNGELAPRPLTPPGGTLAAAAYPTHSEGHAPTVWARGAWPPQPATYTAHDDLSKVNKNINK
jgi:hypothetical protein